MRKSKCRMQLILLNVCYIFLCFFALIPILYALLLSFKRQSGALVSGMWWLPENLTFENYRRILIQEPFLLWFKNSSVLSVGTMLIAVGFAVLSAYAFSRYRFAGRRAMLNLLLLLNAFPQILSMFALFRLFKNIGLLNSNIGLILIYAGSMCIFSIWNLKGYFDTVPIEIEEAAKIDGANDFQLLLRIMLPLAVPAIIVTSVMVLIFVWNEYLFATTFMFHESSYTLAGGLYQLQADDYSRSWPLFSAAAIMVSVPVLIVFFLIQRYMVSGLTAGGVKG